MALRPMADGATCDISRMVAELSSSSSSSARSANGFLDHCRSAREAVIEKLLPFLSQMSLGFHSSRCCIVNAFSALVPCGDRQVKVTFGDVSALSDLLFEELEGAIRNIASFLASPTVISLLRCCIKLLTPLGFNQSFVLKKCQVLHSLLAKLCCQVEASMLLFGDKEVSYWKRSISREYTVSTDGVLKSRIEVSNEFIDASAIGLDVLCPILEVFVDELLMNQDFQQYLMTTDSITSVSKKLFKSQHTYGNVANVLEVVSAHFLHFFSDESAVTKFSKTLFWSCNGNLKPSELSLSSAMVLLGIIANTAATYLLKTHVISLVAKSIGICMNLHHKKEDLGIHMLSYVSAFEVSVDLYLKHSSVLEVIDHYLKADNSFDLSEKERSAFGFGMATAFESFVQPVTSGRIDLQSLKFAESCSPIFDKKFYSFDLMSATLSYINDIKPLFDPSFTKEISEILNCITLKCLTSVRKDTSLKIAEEETAGKICYLSALLKLMGCSLLQIVYQIRGSHNASSLKTLNDYAHCREYHFIADILGSFRHWRPQSGIIASGALLKHPETHKETKLVIVHFCSLLLFCYETGSKFLWKSCIFVLMVFINLLVFEEGNVDALNSILQQPAPYCPRNYFKSKIYQDMASRKSSQLVLSNVRKTKSQFRGEPKTTDLIEREDEDGDKACNGEAFIESILGMEEKGKRPRDYEELADFIVCKHGKDYKSWLNSRKIFRSWSHEKAALARQQKKRKLKRLLWGLNDESNPPPPFGTSEHNHEQKDKSLS
ncbi:hypothetical protein EJ110_NYTH11541 [Nymphaea thermarum]|nr:hypothetical protein EJ110_NYTH11541 [Nymphaea thermarum]